MADGVKKEVSTSDEGFEKENVVNRPESYPEITATKTEVVEELYNLEPLCPQNTIDMVFVKGSPVENPVCGNWESESEENRYRCEPCYLEFQERKNLMKHYRYCPNKNQNITKQLNIDGDVFVCTFCKLQILDKECYSRHVQRCKRKYLLLNKEVDVNTKIEKIYQCDKCSYSANYKSCLEEHTLVHSGRQRFTCGICGTS